MSPNYFSFPYFVDVSYKDLFWMGQCANLTTDSHMVKFHKITKEGRTVPSEVVSQCLRDDGDGTTWNKIMRKLNIIKWPLKIRQVMLNIQ